MFTLPARSKLLLLPRSIVVFAVVSLILNLQCYFSYPTISSKMIELAVLAGLAVSFGLVYVLFNCVCLPFPRKRTGFSTFDNTSLDAEIGGNYSLYTSHDGSGDSSRITFEPLPDILAKTVAATALKPRITCLDNERQKLAAKSVCKELDHPNVVKLLGLCTESVPFLTILEQSAYGDLKTYLIRHKREAEAMVRRGMLIKCLLDMSAGLACLHRHGYVHHDFACRNCLLMGDMSVKIGDYGISEDKFREEYYDTGQDLLPVRWMAPETLTQNGNLWQVTKFTKEANIWYAVKNHSEIEFSAIKILFRDICDPKRSFGVAMWEVIELEKLPYFSMSDEDVLQKVVAEKKIKLPISHSSGIQKQKLNEVMQFCWLDERNRPSIEDVYRLIDQINKETGSKKEDFDTKWEKLTSKDSRIVKVEVHTSAQNNKITRIDTDHNNTDLKKLTSTDISKIGDTSPIVNSKDGGLPKIELSERSRQKSQSNSDEMMNDSFVVVSENNQIPSEISKTNFLSNATDLGLSSEPITPISSSSNRRTYQLTSTPVSVERPSATAAVSIQNNMARELGAEVESESPVQTIQNTDVVDSVIETPKQTTEKTALNLDKNKVKRILLTDTDEKSEKLTDTDEKSEKLSDLNVPKNEIVKEVDEKSDNKDVQKSDNIDYNRCESVPESVDSKNGEAYDTSDIEYVLEGGDIRIHEIDDNDDDKNDQVKFEQLKLSIADAFNINNQKFDNERRNSDPESPDDYETLVAKEIYMSKGTTIPPTRHTTPRSLTTIPEDSIATNEMSGPGLRFIEPVEDSLFTSSVQDSFEWDDYIGEQLVGHVKNSENSPRQSMEFQDWTLDQDSSQESDSQNNSKMEDSNKRANGSSSSSISTPYSSSDSEVKHSGVAARSIISDVIAKSNRKSNHPTNPSHPLLKNSFYALSHAIDVDSPEHVPYDSEPSGSPGSFSSGSNQFNDEWELINLCYCLLKTNTENALYCKFRSCQHKILQLNYEDDDERNDDSSIITEKGTNSKETVKENGVTITKLNREKEVWRSEDKPITKLNTEKEEEKDKDKTITEQKTEKKEEGDEDKTITKMNAEKEEEGDKDKTITKMNAEKEEEGDEDKTITEQNVEDTMEDEEDTTITN
ncbi:hypothetical protein KUTeg_003778 [Tegillarca granosa]|uniref:Protein kinase domain-containing protein n=1 Tax=Tegillarca granosa TaxID=220873 RepID=A0ABQ9FRW6_TEGGR|nr:hypothetical protein KUTeg_003778 [Tegillarca granosa]